MQITRQAGSDRLHRDGKGYVLQMSEPAVVILSKPVAPQPDGSYNPVVVAWLYNKNGMAAWCWEAAHALHELGHSVILVASIDADLPGNPAFEVLRIDSPDKPARRSGRLQKLGVPFSRFLSAEPDGLLAQIHKELTARSLKPLAYVLNQSSLVDRSVSCPQLVAAWAYPTTLFGYLRKVPRLAPDKSVRALLRTALHGIGWWRKDWRGYRMADRVLPVTAALMRSLSSRSVSSDLAYPGTCIGPPPICDGEKVRLFMAAVNLSEPRKRILWMLKAMKGMTLPQGTVLQLAGEADLSVRQAAVKLGFPVEFLGHLKREDLQRVMQQASIFCFGSLLDDWGYVLVEAMANGLVPVAPGISPFDEIIGEIGSSYKPGSQQDFVRALQSIATGSLAEKRCEAWNRAQTLFSRASFGRAILRSVASTTRP